MKQTATYRSGKELEVRGLDMLNDQIWVMLLSEDYEFSENHASRAEITKFEIYGPGYAAGGRGITGRRLLWAGSVLQVKADDVIWPKATLRAKYAVIYRARGGDASKDELFCCLDFGDNVASMNGPFRIEWPDGIMKESL